MGNVFIRVNSKETMENQMTKKNTTKTKLTLEDLEVIQKTHDILRDVLDSIYDIHDINLSQIKELDLIFYKLRYHFELDENIW
jgi:hypothetical protein